MKRFEDIHFDARDSRTVKWFGRYLPGWYWAPKEMFAVAWHQTCDGIALLEPGKRYSAEDLCDPHFWNTLWGGEPYMLGRCIKYLVVNGYLPLVEANAGKKGKRMYVLDLEQLPQWMADLGLLQVA
jgi:hypothetical protein